MFYLLLVSVIWAFSFGIISVSFGDVDPVLLAFLRMGLAMLLFLPFTGLSRISLRSKAALMGIGAIQYGLMYVCLFSAFQYIGQRSYLIALFTLTTPIYVLLFSVVLERRRGKRAWLAVMLSVLGAGVIQWQTEMGIGYWKAFVLLQASNAAFAFGQIAYRRCQNQIRQQSACIEDRHFFAWVFLGAVIFTGLAGAAGSDWRALGTLDSAQWTALVYLGLIASGLCFFWWNRGATMVTPPILAVLNNLKVPLAVVVSLVVFQEWTEVAWIQFILGSALIMLAFLLSQHSKKAA